MELRQIASTLWKWAWLLILATAVAAASSWWVVKDQPPIYQTSTTLMVGTTIQQVSPDYSEFYTAERLAQTYSELIKREPVLKATAAALGFESDWRALRGQISASLVAGTQLMEVRVIDTDPVRAKQLADEVTRQLMNTVEQARPQGSSRTFIQEQVDVLPGEIQTTQEEINSLRAQLAETTSAREIQDLKTQISALETQVNSWRSTFAQYQLLLGDTGVNVLSVIEEAPVPSTPLGGRGTSQILLAAAIGLMLALGAAFLIEYLDDTVKTPDDVERKTNLPTFGVIIRFPHADGEGPLTALEPRSSIAEGYRVLRTNLQFATMGLNKARQESGCDGSTGTVLLVTSSQPTEGKTTTVANLGVSLAQAGKKVLVVDGDLRRPSLHKLFKLQKDIGLTSLLLEREANLQFVAQKTGIENLRVLPSGPVPANPAEVLGFAEMDELIKRLRTMADFVLIDSPPVLSVADTSVLAQKVDGVLVVVEAGLTRTEMFERAVTVLQRVKAHVLGTILTKVGAHRGAYSYDYYYYYSSYYSEDGTHKKERRHRDRTPWGRLKSSLRRLLGRDAHPRTRGSSAAAAAAAAALPASTAPPEAGPGGRAGPDEPPPRELSQPPPVDEDEGYSPFELPLEPPLAGGEEPPEEPILPLTAEFSDEEEAALPELEPAAPLPEEEPVTVEAENQPLYYPAVALSSAPAEPVLTTVLAVYDEPPTVEQAPAEVLPPEPPVEEPPPPPPEPPVEPPAEELPPTPRPSTALLTLTADNAAEADALYAEALDLYRHEEWPRAREALLRLTTIDPQRRAVDSLLQEVEEAMGGAPARQAAPQPPAAPARHLFERPRPPVRPAPRQSGSPRPPRTRVRPLRAILLFLALAGAIVLALCFAGVIPVTWPGNPFRARQVQQFITRGYDYFILDDYEQAVASFNEALALDPNNKEAVQGLQNASRYQKLRDHYANAHTLMEQRDYQAAIVALETIIQTDPWYKEADRLLAQCQASLQRETLRGQAMTYYGAGQWAKAAAAFREVLAKGMPDLDGAIRSKLIECYVNQGRQEIGAAASRSEIIHATQSFNSALALDSANEAAQRERQLASRYLDAFTAYESGDWRKAISELMRIYADQPDYGQEQAVRLLCRSYLELGDTYLGSGQPDAALEQYNLILTYHVCDPAEANSRIDALTATPTPAPSTTPAP